MSDHAEAAQGRAGHFDFLAGCGPRECELGDEREETRASMHARP
jgi:hypothetical protein